jgi:putative oxidoreductase
MNADFGLLVLRVVLGVVVAAHGLQKFGFLKGYGLKGITQGFRSMGFWPAEFWAPLIAVVETAGSALLILGLGGPIVPGLIAADLAVAAVVVHWPKGFWVTDGGIEFVALISAAGVALVFVGYGRWSLDHVLGITYAGWMRPVWAVAMAVGVVLALGSRALRPSSPSSTS